VSFGNLDGDLEANTENSALFVVTLVTFGMALHQQRRAEQAAPPVAAASVPVMSSASVRTPSVKEETRENAPSDTVEPKAEASAV
jgi:hypothetical protein